MATKTLKSSFTITFLSGTDSLYVEEQVVKFEDDNSSVESAGSLMQVYCTGDASVTPDWTDTTKQPCIKLGLTKSSDGSNIGLTDDCAFAYQGETISFGTTAKSLNGLSWYESTGDFEGMFMKAYSDTSDGSDAYVYLRICANIASAKITTNQQIDYTLTYDDSTFGSGSVTGTTDILVREGSSSSLYCNIIPASTELSTSVPSSVLSVEYIIGGAVYTTIAAVNTALGTSYSLAWHKDGDSSNTITSAETLTVYREEDDDSGADTGNYVDGCNVFTVCILDSNGDTIASDSQRITDVADEYRVKLTSTGTVRSNTGITVKGILYKGDAAYTGSVTYGLTVSNADNEEKYSTTVEDSTTGFSIDVEPEYCALTKDSGTEHDDAILAVECTF